MYVKLIKNFVDKSDLNHLNLWSLSNFKKNIHQYSDACMDEYLEETRFTTRLKNEVDHKKENIKIDYPSVAYKIQDKVINQLGLHGVKTPPSFVDGIVNGIGFEGGSICEHIDPVYYNNTHTLHCNVISQKSNSGGVTIIENVQYDVDEGDLLCYIVSKHRHEVTKTSGSKLRILWVFGFCVDNVKLNQIFSKN